MSEALTVEQFKAALPVDMQKNVNPLLLMRINNVLTNPEESEMLKENLVSYASVLSQGKFKMDQYINAVRYVGYRVMGAKIKEAYQKTFPEKVKKFHADGVAEKDIASYSTAYNKSKLVNLIFEQTLIPTHILNAPLFQQALNVQAEIMMDTRQSGMVRSNAANSLMTHLKAPETKKVELDVGVNAGDIIDDMEMMMHRMVEQQMKMIGQGGDLKQITNAPVVKQEVIDV